MEMCGIFTFQIYLTTIIMNKKFLILSLGLGLFLTGCQTENISEDMPTENAFAIANDSDKQISNKIHTPDWMAAIHTPDWMAAAFGNCDNFPEYTGNANLNVGANDSYSFRREVMLENLGVGGELNICGRLGVANKTVVRRSGMLTVAGMMTVGDEHSAKDLRINYGGHLDIRGFLVVTGDLILGNGATLKFINNDDNAEIGNKLIVLGEVIQAENSYLIGDYEYSSDLHDLEEEHEH